MVIQGLIRPPPEIRVVADRTALYVAKNGRTFETRILNSAKGQTPKFAFLHATSPFHAYYEDRINFYENGGTDEKENKEQATVATPEEAAASDSNSNNASEVPVGSNQKGLATATATGEETTKTTKTQKASAIDPIARALLTQRTKIAEIRNSTTTTAMDETNMEHYDTPNQNATTTTTIPPSPPFLSLVQIVPPASLSVTQLETIQWTAQIVALSRPTGVPFLQELTMREWNNPDFGFCQPRHGHFAYFSALVDAYCRICTDCRYGDATKQKTTDSTGSDWILPLANNIDQCLTVTAYRAEYQRDQAEQARIKADGGLSSTTAVPIDWHDFVVVETIDFGVDEIVTMLPPPPPQASLMNRQEETTTRDTDAMEDSDEENETIRVVPSYTPRVYAAHESNAQAMVIDPISGKPVAVKDMPEHMRIQLLDPKWAEERKKFQDKQKESNLVGGDMVASNLERFAQARGDRFGKREQDLLSQEAESKKRLEDANRIIREQGQSQLAVGPSLPATGVRKEPPIGPTVSEEPTTKKAKVITYAPAVLQPPLSDSAAAAETGDPFAAAATGVAAQPPTSEMSPTTGDVPPPSTTPEFIPEADFVASLAGKLDIPIQIRVPNDPSQMAWNFYGQIVSLSVNVMSQVKTVKGELSKAHLNGLPANKIQLKNPVTGSFLKDNLTLAALNVGPSATLELVPRARGGKKK